jgi:mannose-6-phosphate isomerase-like protein (cupin superfamily)
MLVSKIAKMKRLDESQVTDLNPEDLDVRNISKETMNNMDYRKVLVMADNLQLVLMSIPPNEEIGMEVHKDGDQFIRIEKGQGKVELSSGEVKNFGTGFSIIIKAGIYHNILNTSPIQDLKLYSIYAPPQHEEGEVKKTKDFVRNLGMNKMKLAKSIYGLPIEEAKNLLYEYGMSRAEINMMFARMNNLSTGKVYCLPDRIVQAIESALGNSHIL